MTTKFFTFRQNNSGGSLIIDNNRGIGKYVIIEAQNEVLANEKAEKIGIYFDGCINNIDCLCCGDRWNRVLFVDGENKPDLFWNSSEYKSFIHYSDNRIELIK